MDGARIAEGGEEVTDATVRTRIRVDWRLAGGLPALLGAPMAACNGCGERDGGIGHGETHSRTDLARVVGEVESVADVRRQDGRGSARNRARAPLNWVFQGQRCGRCKVSWRAERVSRPAREKKRRRGVLVVTTGSPRPMRAVQRARLWATTSAQRRWGRARPACELTDEESGAAPRNWEPS